MTRTRRTCATCAKFGSCVFLPHCGCTRWQAAEYEAEGATEREERKEADDGAEA